MRPKRDLTGRTWGHNVTSEWRLLFRNSGFPGPIFSQGVRGVRGRARRGHQARQRSARRDRRSMRRSCGTVTQLLECRVVRHHRSLTPSLEPFSQSSTRSQTRPLALRHNLPLELHSLRGPSNGAMWRRAPRIRSCNTQGTEISSEIAPDALSSNGPSHRPVSRRTYHCPICASAARWDAPDGIWEPSPR